ncbi:alpha-amylase family glycosyl hydrolase [Pseudobacteroides cellulosolvens]|uniref:Alpha amylase catalytic region n=1 Tax=Pseudobacteroides cellulosolvens ATCC 35603 = DSM 2933 TaxID=398512 RepID=A0A0L6JJP8_9FIRM|nr:alpha-amylase family glycosyl hydrolase [Pseudobacteroides cellulosolvens]KNY25617.1 alpha amylase catalytic region [Pseudobacteroides cellulosolvens ATCC 35603 = DSM 2933]
MVIYELHVPTFIGKNDGQKYPGNFKSLLTKLDYIKSLGFNAIEILPIHEYAGDSYLGYAPASFFPVESSYGSDVGKSYDELKEFVNAAHKKELTVIVDVVFNHFTDRTGVVKFIWAYNGDDFYGKGGIYLSGYQTPWGPDPNWERNEVIRYVEDTCRYYLSELHFDGLRFDVTTEIINKPNGWNALRDILCNLQITSGSRITFIAVFINHGRNFNARG